MTTTVLIVEDEMIPALHMAAELTNRDFDVVGIASTGIQAIKMAGMHHPDAIVMDVRLNGDMDGIEAASAITRMLKPHAPAIVIVTSKPRNTLPKGAQEYDYIPKPLSVGKLAESIRAAVCASTLP